MSQKLRKYSLRYAQPQDQSPLDPEYRCTIKRYAIAFDDKEIVFGFLETNSPTVKYALHELSGKPSALKDFFDSYPRLVKKIENSHDDPIQALRDFGFTDWKE